MQTWLDPEAERYLSWPADQPLPKSDHLQQLLERTRKLLAEPLRTDAIDRNRAASALECKAVVVLTRLLHMLQQHLSHKFNTPSVGDPFQSVWFCVVSALTAVTNGIQTSSRRVGHLRTLREGSLTEKSPGMPDKGKKEACRKQMEQATGMSY